MGRRRCRFVALAVLLLAAGFVAAIPPPAASNLAGVFDARDRGCYCHAPAPSDAVGFTVTGLPGRYTPGANYTIEINVTFTDVPAAPNRSQGGFYLEASAGNLSVPQEMAGLVQLNGLEASHTANGSMLRWWTVVWSAPGEPGLIVTFFVVVNTVNGNKSETFGTDHWTQKTVRIGVGDAPEITGPPPVRPPLAFETLGMLAAGAIFGGYALYTFHQVRKPAGSDAPDSRYRRRGRRDRPKEPS